MQHMGPDNCRNPGPTVSYRNESPHSPGAWQYVASPGIMVLTVTAGGGQGDPEQNRRGTCP